MRRLFISVSTLLLVLTLSTGRAQSQNSVRTMTLGEAFECVLEQNASLRAADYAIKSAEHSRRAAIGLRMPTINIGGSFCWMGDDMAVDLNNLKQGVANGTESLVQALDPALGQALQEILAPLATENWELILQQRAFASIGANATIPIFTGGRINVVNRAAKIGEKMARNARDGVESQLMSELVERYFGVLLARSALDVRHQVSEGLRQHLADAISLERNGVVAASERLYVEYRLAEAIRDERKAQYTLHTAEEALQNSLGGMAIEPITAMFVVEHPENADYFSMMALDHCTLLRQASLGEDLARENLRLQRADFYPQVAAIASTSLYNWQVSTIVPRWAVGVGVNIKLFDGLTREYRYSAAKQSLRSAESTVAKAESDVVLMVESLHAEMMAQLASLRSIEASITFAEEYLRSRRIAFTEGVCSSSDLIDAELNYARSRIERLEAAYQFDIALARLLAVAGAWSEFIDYSNRADSRTITY